MDIRIESFNHAEWQCLTLRSFRTEFSMKEQRKIMEIFCQGTWEMQYVQTVIYDSVGYNSMVQYMFVYLKVS